MEQHPIPRQITSFEFKLIGFMTLKQFLYLVIFFPLGYVVYFLFPIPILNIIIAIGVGFIGVALAFLPINDRPLDIWLKNVWKRLNSPTQYSYQKHNPPVSFFNNLYYVSDPHHMLAHIESQQKLSAYLAKTRQTMLEDAKKKKIQNIIQDSHHQGNRVAPPTVGVSPTPPPFQLFTKPVTQLKQPIAQGEKKPFFVGVVKNNKKIPLPGIMVYVKDDKNVPVRLMKTNPHGIFATFNPLPPAEYTFEVKDPKNNYFFDTMKVPIQLANEKPIELFSKEML